MTIQDKRVMTVRRSAAFASLMILPGLFSGCIAKYTSTPYGALPEGYAHRGVPYKLPKTVFDYKVIYSVYERKVGDKVTHFVWLDTSIEGDPAESEPLTVTPKVVGDDSAVFVVDTNDLSVFNVATSGSEFKLNDEGLLTEANGDFEDKTTDIITNSVGAALNVAKIAAFPGSAARSGETDTIRKIATIPISGKFDYSSMRGSGGARYYTVPTAPLHRHLDLVGGTGGASIPAVTFHIDGARAGVGADFDPRRGGAVQKLAVSKQNGIWVRQPARLRLRAIVGGTTMLEDRVLVADAGAVTLVPIKSKIATDRKTKLDFSTNTGAIVGHSFSTTSQGEKISATAKSLTTQVGEALPGINEAKANRRTADAELQNNLVAKRRELEDAQEGLIDLDAKIEANKTAYGQMQDNPRPEGMSEEEFKEKQNANRSEQKTLQESRKAKVRQIEDIRRGLNQMAR